MYRAAALALLVFGLQQEAARAGFLYVADQGAADILRINTATGAQTVVASGGYLSTPYDLAVAQDGSLLVANRYGQDIIRVDPNTAPRASSRPEATFATRWALPWH